MDLEAMTQLERKRIRNREWMRRYRDPEVDARWHRAHPNYLRIWRKNRESYSRILGVSVRTNLMEWLLKPAL